MARVQTVLGNIAPEVLGHTQPHEHIYLRKGPSFFENKALCMEDEQRSLQELQDYRAAGGACIVDAQPYGCGRDAEALYRLSKESNVLIVASTGFHKRCFWEPESYLFHASSQELEALFVAELTEGMLTSDNRPSSIPAGLVKIVFESGALEDTVYRGCLEAAANASIKTGAPLLIHTEPNTSLIQLADFLGNIGLPPHALIFCHADRTCPNTSVHMELMSRGCWFCYDSIHRLKYLSDEQELTLLKQMKDAGHLQRMLLSLDTTNMRLRAYKGEIGLDYILTEYIPLLHQVGFTDQDLTQICILNPQRALCFRETERKIIL